MGVKEKNPGILIAKNNNIFTAFISLAFVVVGIYLIIQVTIKNFDLSAFETYLGPIFLIVAVAVFLFFWKTTTLILDKNQNTFSLTIKNLMKKIEQKGALSDIKEIRYSESIQYSASARRGSSRTIHKTVEMFLNNGEMHVLFQQGGSYNPLFNRTKRRAQKIADFLGLQLNIVNLGSALRNAGQAISNQFNLNQQQSNQQHNQQESNHLNQTTPQPNQEEQPENTKEDKI